MIARTTARGPVTRALTAADVDVADRIHRLWDELAEFDVASHDQALEHLLRTLCELVGAQNAAWYGAVRLPELAADDALRGWRPRLYRFLHSSRGLENSIREQTARIERQEVDPSLACRVDRAGELRVNRLKDLLPRAWFDSDYYRTFYVDLAISDAIIAACPVNTDTEIHFSLLRAVGRPRFTTAERDTIHGALRSLRWFHRQYLLSHGLLVATAPLTVAEREVLHGLLSGRTEKEIAVAQGRGAHTTHEYVKAIYRKFGVTSRAALMALWLGRLP